MLEFAEKIEKEIPAANAADISEQMILYWLIRGIQPERVVEVGTHRGKTALYMAHALYDNKKGKLFTVDPFDWDARANFKKFPELEKYIVCQMIKGTNLDVNNIDLLFIDGYHEEEFVAEEIEYFLPRLSERAVVIFHDAGGDNQAVGVNRAVLKSGLKTAWIPTPNCIRIYGHLESPPESK